MKLAVVFALGSAAAVVFAMPHAVGDAALDPLELIKPDGAHPIEPAPAGTTLCSPPNQAIEGNENAWPPVCTTGGGRGTPLPKPGNIANVEHAAVQEDVLEVLEQEVADVIKRKPDQVVHVPAPAGTTPCITRPAAMGGWPPVCMSDGPADPKPTGPARECCSQSLKCLCYYHPHNETCNSIGCVAKPSTVWDPCKICNNYVQECENNKFDNCRERLCGRVAEKPNEYTAEEVNVCRKGGVCAKVWCE